MFNFKHNIEVEMMYKKDILKTKLLSKKKQLELLEKAQHGDDEAKNKLIVCNLRFILKCVKPYTCKHIKQCDLVNEGVLGLIRAIETFEISKGFVFISYAVWWIRVYIHRAIIEKDNLIKLPETVITRIKNQIKNCSNNNDLPFDVYKHIKMKQKYLSYNSPVRIGDDLILADTLEDKTSISPEYLIKDCYLKDKIIDTFLNTLPELEKYIITHSYGIGVEKLSIDKISKRLKIGIVSIKNLKSQALERIRRSDKYENQREIYYN